VPNAVADVVPFVPPVPPAPPVGPSITFLTRDEARAAIVDESKYPYYSLLRPAEMSAKTGRAITGDTLDAKRNECRRRYQDSVRDFTDEEKAAVSKAVARMHPALAAEYPVMAALPWKFVKATGDIEGGLPHTRNDFIVLPERTVRDAVHWATNDKMPDMQFAFRTGSLLVHEQVHVFQRLNPGWFDSLYTDVWGFRKASSIQGCAWLDERQLVNPDATECPWVLPVRNADGSETILWPLVMLDSDGETPRMPDDMAMVGVTVVRDGQGYKVVTDKSGMPQHEPLYAAESYVRRLPFTDSIYHPAEAAADLFAKCVLVDHFVPVADGEGVTEVKALLKPAKTWFATHLNDLPKARFQWKALWVWIGPDSTADDVRKMVDTAADTGFNVLIVNSTGGGKAIYQSTILPTPEGRTFDPFGEAVRLGHEKGLQVYAWVTYLARSGEGTFQKSHPEFVQVVTPAEEAAARAGRRTHPDRVDIHAGGWLCPDRGLTEYEKSFTEEIVRSYAVDGVAIDFLGYRNYRCCRCEFSNAQRAAFAKAHPDLSPAEVERQFSTQSMVEFSRQVRRTVQAVRPATKMAIHIYPDFDPDPEYGHLLDVDYCGQTIAWFFKPYWSAEKVQGRHLAFLKVEGQPMASNRHVPFIGCRHGDLEKPAEQLRREIRLAGLGGCDRIMFAFYETLTASPHVAAVLREELR
jgi:hypothetical protein